MCAGTDVAVADAAAKGATDTAAVGAADTAGVAAADAGAVAGGAAAADTAAGVTAADAAAAGTATAGAADAAAAGGGGALAGGGAATATAADTAAVEATLPGITVTAPAAAGTGGAGLSDIASTGLLTGATAAGVSGGGGGGGPGTQPVDKTSFLPATNDASPAPLAPDLAQNFGIDTGSGGYSGALSPGGGTGDISGASVPDISGAATDSGGGGSWEQDLTKWLSNPRNDATAALLGLSLKNAITQPKLPGAAQTALNAAGPGIKNAQAVIESGGTATAEWAGQKASIDATIDEQIRQQTEALMQAAANSGEGNQNSGIVQQQIADMTRQANVERQQLYRQAQQQNVNNAVAELTGDNQTLASIANMQLSQSQEAQQLAAQTAELALLLNSGKVLNA